MTIRIKRPASEYRLALQTGASAAQQRAFPAQQALIILAVGLVVFVAAMFFVPRLAGEEAGMNQEDAAMQVASANFEGDSLIAQATGATVGAADTAKTPAKEAEAPTRQQQWVTDWLARRYRVANDATHMLVSTAYATAKETKLDPLLILAVMAIESGLNPFAESPVGAKGLMQVMAHVHRDRFADHGGVKAALNPEANIKVGSAILKEYVQRGGSIEAGLKYYVGAGAFETDQGYGSRVMTEYRRLKDVSSGKKVPISFPTLVKRPVAPAPAVENAAPVMEAAAEPQAQTEQVAAL